MSVTVKGLDKALADLDKKGDAVVAAVKQKLSDVATDIEIQAGQAAPKSYSIGDETIDLRFIQQKINKDVFENGLLWKVGLSVPSSGEQWEAWMEFGTGLSASEILSNPQYSQEVRNIARTFFRNGRGRIIGKPYLMPSFFKNTANLVQEIENEIKKDIK
jgi:hypothetical protein